MGTDLRRESVIFDWNEIIYWKTRRLFVETTASTSPDAIPSETSTLSSPQCDELDSGPGWVVHAEAQVLSLPARAGTSFNEEIEELLVWRLVRRPEKDRKVASLWLEIARKRFYALPQTLPDPASLQNLAISQARLAQVTTGERWLLPAEPVPQIVFSSDHTYCYLLVAGTLLYCVKLSALSVQSHPERTGVLSGLANRPQSLPSLSSSLGEGSHEERVVDSHALHANEQLAFPSDALQVVPLPAEIYLIMRIEETPHTLLAIATDGQLFRIECIHSTGVDSTSASYTSTPLTTRRSTWNLPSAKSILQTLTTPSRTRSAGSALRSKRPSYTGDNQPVPLLKRAWHTGSQSSSTTVVAAGVARSNILVLYTDGTFRLWDLRRPKLLAESTPWSFPLAPGAVPFLVPLDTETHLNGQEDTMATFLAVLSVHNPGQALHLQLIEVSLRRSDDGSNTPTGDSLDTRLLASGDAPAEELCTCCYLPYQRALCLGWANGAISLVPLPIRRDSSGASSNASASRWWSSGILVYTLALEDEADAPLHLHYVLDHDGERDFVDRILAPHRFPLSTIYQALQSWRQAELLSTSELNITITNALDRSLPSWCLSLPMHRQYLRERLEEIAKREPNLADRLLDRIRMFYLEKDVPVFAIRPWPTAKQLSLAVHPWGVALLRPCDEAESMFLSSRDGLRLTDEGDTEPWMALLSRLLLDESNILPADELRPSVSDSSMATRADVYTTLARKLCDALLAPWSLTGTDELESHPTTGLIATLAATSLSQVAEARRALARIGLRFATEDASKSDLTYLLEKYAFMVQSATSPELADQHGHNLAERMIYSGEWIHLMKMRSDSVGHAVWQRSNESLTTTPWWALLPTLVEPSPSLVCFLATNGQLKWALQLVGTFFKDDSPAVYAHLAGLLALQGWSSVHGADPLPYFSEAWSRLQHEGHSLDLQLLTHLVGKMSSALDYAERVVELLDDHRAHESARQMARVALSSLREELETQAVSRDGSGFVSVHERTDREIAQTRLAVFLFMRALEANALSEALSVLIDDLGCANPGQTRDALYLMLHKALEMKQVSWLLEQPLPRACFFRIAEALWRLAASHELEHSASLYEQACAAYFSGNEWWLSANVAADWAYRLRDTLEALLCGPADQRMLSEQPLSEQERLTRLQEQRCRALQLALFLLQQAEDKFVHVATSPSLIDELELEREWALVRYQLAVGRHLINHEHSSELRFLFETSDAATRSIAYQLIASPHRFDGESGAMAAIRLACLWWSGSVSSNKVATTAAHSVARRELARIVRLIVEHWHAIYEQHEADDDDDATPRETELHQALEYASATGRTGYIFTPALETWIQCRHPVAATGIAGNHSESSGKRTVDARSNRPSEGPSAETAPLVRTGEALAGATVLASPTSTTQSRTPSLHKSTPSWLIEAAVHREKHLSSILRLLAQRALFLDAARLLLSSRESANATSKSVYVPQSLMRQFRNSLRTPAGTGNDPAADAHSHRAAEWHRNSLALS